MQESEGGKERGEKRYCRPGGGGPERRRPGGREMRSRRRFDGLVFPFIAHYKVKMM